MSNDAAHTKGWQIFEVVFGLPFLAAIGLQRFIPIALLRGLPNYITITVGVLLVVMGVVLVVFARREFTRHSQPTDPGFATGKIISTGVFAYSRNPLYLGGILFLVGISFAFRLSWEIILLVPSMVACHNILIVPEEKYLADKFGAQYREYTETVHRWVGRKAGKIRKE